MSARAVKAARKTTRAGVQRALAAGELSSAVTLAALSRSAGRWPSGLVILLSFIPGAVAVAARWGYVVAFPRSSRRCA